jgi:hypothetical protein
MCCSFQIRNITFACREHVVWRLRSIFIKSALLPFPMKRDRLRSFYSEIESRQSCKTMKCDVMSCCITWLTSPKSIHRASPELAVTVREFTKVNYSFNIGCSFSWRSTVLPGSWQCALSSFSVLTRFRGKSENVSEDTEGRTMGLSLGRKRTNELSHTCS